MNKNPYTPLGDDAFNEAATPTAYFARGQQLLDQAAESTRVGVPQAFIEADLALAVGYFAAAQAAVAMGEANARRGKDAPKGGPK